MNAPKGEDFSGEAENTIELADKLKKIGGFAEQHISQIVRHAVKTSSNPSIYSWSRNETYTYAWTEKKGYIWSSTLVPDYHWFEPKYEVGMEHQYAWSIQHDYSYAKTFNYDVRTPQYVVRTVEPKTSTTTEHMYSYRYDSEKYIWEEEMPEENSTLDE